jgi:hypothetical protein
MRVCMNKQPLVNNPLPRNSPPHNPPRRLETLKNVVMNPYSHPSAPNIPKLEVERATDAVDEFLKLVAKK